MKMIEEDMYLWLHLLRLLRQLQQVSDVFISVIDTDDQHEPIMLVIKSLLDDITHISCELRDNLRPKLNIVTIEEKQK